MEPLIPEVADVVDRAAAWATSPDAREHLGVLHGPPTAGKTLALHSLAARLVEQGMRVFRLSPASDQADTCAQIVAEMGDQDDAFRGIAERVSGTPAERARQIHEALGSLARQGARVALLFDEPRLDDTPPGDPDPLMARALAGERAMARELTAKDGVVRIVSLPTLPPGAQGFEFTTRAPQNWLQRQDVWGPLSRSARLLAEAMPSAGLRSALHLRLAVALVELKDPVEGIGEILRRDSEFVTTELARRAWVQASDALHRAWARVALVRRPLDTAQLDELAGELEPRDRELLRRGLLYQIGTQWFMHESVRAAGGEFALAAAEHDEVAKRYSARSADSLVASVEAFHHWLASGHPERARDLRLIDLDQYNQLGRVLSLQGKYTDAAAVFESVLRKRADDDYASHYLAFNLDRLAADPGRVEEHYRAATKLAPSNVWWHARYVNFLITRGRDRDAQLAWIEALNATGSQAALQNSWYYENLHRWVAELLLARAETEWAGAILAQVPEHVFGMSSDLRRLRDRQRALIEVDSNGAVFPLWVDHSTWWKSPHLLPPRARKGAKEHELTGWWAARVESLDRSVVYLLYGQLEADGQPTYGRTSIRKRTLEGWLGDSAGEEIEPGRFLEIGFYGPNGKIVRARAHARTSPVRLDDTQEDTARYLRNPRPV